MRIKIIAVNALIIAVVGLLSFWLVRTALSAATTDQTALSNDARRDVQGAAAKLQLDALRAERWLTAEAAKPDTIASLTKATDNARGEAATKRSDEIASGAKGVGIFEGTVPTLVALVDTQGKIVGRNGTNLERRNDIAASNPGLKATITTGQSGSDVWVDKDRFIASYVAVHDESGKIVGALVIGRPLNDALTRASDATTGRALALVVQGGSDISVVGSSNASPPAFNDAISGGAKDTVKNAFTTGHSDVAHAGDLLVGVSPLDAFGDGKHAVLATSAPSQYLENAANIPLPVLGATALGIVLVIIAGWLLGNYITRPIQMLEEGLLAILNGQTDKRFELDHTELGGLAFRIDQLLNQLMGVEEDTTDAEGRPSRAPSAANFSDAMAVDDKRMNQPEGEGTLDPESVARLASEPAAGYYARIYAEYIAAKKALGEPTDHISEQAFSSRIQGMEKDAATKYGRPVRYQVQARNNEVVLLAVPL